MITFKLVKGDKPVVLIFRDGKLIAAIHRHEEGVRLVSEYYDGVQNEPGSPPSVVVKFSKNKAKRST